MKESTQDCIKNCLGTTLGTHVLYRNYGVALVDGTNIPLRKDVLVQLSTYYPEVSLNEVTIKESTLDGQYTYVVDVKSR